MNSLVFTRVETQVETMFAALGSVVEPTQIRDLPLNGRNFEELSCWRRASPWRQTPRHRDFLTVPNADAHLGSRVFYSYGSVV